MTDLDKPDFLTAMARLCVALREKEPDVTQLRVYFEALKDLEIEFVIAAGERLMQAQWFPKTGEWRAAAEKVEAERQEQQRAALREIHKGGQYLCDACADTGWRLRPDDLRALRCECVKTRRLELLGRRPMPQLTEGAAPQRVVDVPRLVSKGVKGMGRP